MQLLSSLGYFLITIGVLVTIHEFGHFWVAKKLGVKVLRFSVGFGKVLLAFQRGETQYTLCAIPLGGYVKMLDENEAKVDALEKHRAFNTQSVYTRIAIVVAGPLANFMLAILLYTFIFIIGTTGIKPMIGNIESNGIVAQSGLLKNDKLLSINGKPTPTINEFSTQFIQSIESQPLKIRVLSEHQNTHIITLNLSGDFLANPEQGLEKYLGFEFALPKIDAVIDKVLPDSPALKAGIKTGDKILTANRQKIESWLDFVKIVQSNKKIDLDVLRNGAQISLTLFPSNTKVGVSVFIDEDYLKSWRILVKKEPLDAFIAANEKVYQLTLLNLKMIRKMLIGEASIKQISGPITIANYAGKTADFGWLSFLSFLALISVGLGLLNLLPIPLLDGGHLLLYAIEIIKGSAPSRIFQQNLAKIGVFIIASLTIIALYNDLFRLFQL